MTRGLVACATRPLLVTFAVLDVPVPVLDSPVSGGLLGLLGGHAQRYQLAFDGKQPLTWGNVFGVTGSDWNLPDSNRTVAGQ